MDELEILSKASPSAFKVLHAMRHLSGGTGEPFVAPNSLIQSLTNLAYGTVSSSRQELIMLRLVQLGPDGSYVLPGSGIQNSGDLTPRRGVASDSKKRLKPYVKTRMNAVKKREGSQNLNAHRERTEKHEAVLRACAILGCARTGSFVSIATGKLTRRMKDGHTIEEALEVVRWARRQYDEVNRWPKYLNLVYLWGAAMFSEAIAAARTTPAGPVTGEQKGYTTIADPDERRKWHEDFMRRAAERGL